MSTVTIQDERDFCKFYYKDDCAQCPLHQLEKEGNLATCIVEYCTPDTEMRLIEKEILRWKKEHKLSRYEKLKTIFPNYNAIKDSEIPDICPQKIDTNIQCLDNPDSCTRCKTEYWLHTEIK